MTGEGVTLPHEDAEELDRRVEALEAEMRPRSELARQLLPRIALHMLRLGRAAEHEARAIAYRMRHAGEAFDEARLAEVDRLMSWIAAEPATNARLLRKSPEGIERLIVALVGLRADLARQDGYRWNFEHSEQLHHLLGTRSADVPVTRVRALSEAIKGNFVHLEASEGAGRDETGRRVWAIDALIELMTGEIERLKAMLESFDREGLELDRREAAARAMFDDSKEAVLARKYESASERALFRTLREFRELQSEIAEVDTREEVGEDPGEESGSFFPSPPDSPDAETDANPTVSVRGQPASRRRPSLEKLARKGRRRPGKV